MKKNQQTNLVNPSKLSAQEIRPIQLPKSSQVKSYRKRMLIYFLCPIVNALSFNLLVVLLAPFLTEPRDGLILMISPPYLLYLVLPKCLLCIGLFESFKKHNIKTIFIMNLSIYLSLAISYALINLWTGFEWQGSSSMYFLQSFIEYVQLAPLLFLIGFGTGWLMKKFYLYLDDRLFKQPF